MQYSVVQYKQCSVVSTVQCSAVHLSAVKCSAVQCSITRTGGWPDVHKPNMLHSSLHVLLLNCIVGQCSAQAATLSVALPLSVCYYCTSLYSIALHKPLFTTLQILSRCCSVRHLILQNALVYIKSVHIPPTAGYKKLNYAI